MRNFFNKKRKTPFLKRSFTIIELVVVISIIATLSGIVIANVGGVLENSKVSAAGSVQRAMSGAVELYYADMGFYPPDVNRGWDPGLSAPPAGTPPGTPWSPDAPTSGGFSISGATCPYCPADWENIVIQNWHGPYLAQWPQFTPWGGKYDYNYWSVDTVRENGCPSVAGIYMGVEGDYAGGGAIPASAEQKMTGYGFDSPCLNGEAQMLLKAF